MVLLPLVPFLLVLVAYAAGLRLSARIMRRSQLSWRHSLTFVLGIGVFTIASRAVFPGSGSIAPRTIVAAMIFQIAFGGWFLGSRALTAQGQRLGFRRAVLLVLVAMGLLVVGVRVLVEASRMFLPGIDQPPG